MDCSFGRKFTGCRVAIIVLTMSRVVVAQDPLATARDLYVAAAYEDALSLLNGMRASDRRPEDGRLVDQYRALCLIALGRASEGERAIEAIVVVAPSYHPAESEFPPRVRTLFRDVRRRMLPTIIQRKYQDAKAAFDRNDLASAQEGFKQVLDLLGDSDLGSTAAQPPLAELRTLAIGFRDLSVKPALPPPVPQPLRATQTSTPGPSLRPVGPQIYSANDANVLPPSVLRQSFGALADVFAVRSGVVDIVINEVGEVESATMMMSVNAVYDRVALATAKSWRYRPATLNGVAVKFRTSVEVERRAPR